MNCRRIDFSGHAVRQMFARGIASAQALEVVQHGKIIIEYPDDTPYPSALLLGFSAAGPIHAVVAWNPADGACVVVTVYIPDPNLWTDDFERRKTS